MNKETRQCNWNTFRSKKKRERESEREKKTQKQIGLFWQHALDTLDLAFDVRRDRTTLKKRCTAPIVPVSKNGPSG